MKRLLIIIILFISLRIPAHADHLSGGEIYYTLIAQVGGIYQYHVTLRLYRDCFLGGEPLNDNAAISIFDKVTTVRVWDGLIHFSQIINENISYPIPCMTNSPQLCYDIAFYEFDVSLPGNAGGYLIVYQNCCRAAINNLYHGRLASQGATYTGEIPGTRALANAPANNSARFTGVDTVFICAGNYFTYNFPAVDADGDRLVYSFTGALNAEPPPPDGHPPPPPDIGGGVHPPEYPPYDIIAYYRGFSGSSPMGPGVSINANTGLVSGFAPAAGHYLICVSVKEIRNGVVIATQRKEIQIRVGSCEIIRSKLYPEYINCDSLTVHFQNFSNSPLIHSYSWDFGVSGSANDTSSLAQPVFNFPDTGIYIVKLVTNRNDYCGDSTTAIVKIFPGFSAGFVSSNTCLSNPIRFTDTTHNAYGFIDSRTWDFGDVRSEGDTSHLYNPVWTYTDIGSKEVQFIISTNKGCIDTILHTIEIVLKPRIDLAFRDTLICAPDSLQLAASGSGLFSWTPLIFISNSGSPNPIVDPVNTTWYYADLDQTGCHNRDSVRVRVVDHVTLIARSDTTICRNDSVQLGAITDGLRFQWSPAATINDPTLLAPFATPHASSVSYQLIARIGSCTAIDNMIVSTVPYPFANAGPDQIICYNTRTQLNGNLIGSSMSWSPSQYVDHPALVNPIVIPPRTTSFVFSVYDTLGCPKPGQDTVIISVYPKFNVSAGNDTSVVVGQPLQFHASGGMIYQWSPSTGLNSTNIPDPIGIYTSPDEQVIYKLVGTDQTGCSDSALVKVKIFKTAPGFFVPAAFTPNGDGLNDVFLPLMAGMKKINYFSVYNRWGQLLFKTSSFDRGWDGTINGKIQGSGVYLWIVNGVDYTGNLSARRER